MGNLVTARVLGHVVCLVSICLGVVYMYCHSFSLKPNSLHEARD